MIDISCKNLFPKDIHILHQFSWDHNQTPKNASNMQRITYNSSSTPCKFLLSTGMNVSWKIRAFCGCKPWKKGIWCHQNFTEKKLRGTGWTPRHTEYQKLKRLTNCAENYSINARLNLKTRFVSEKKKNTIISAMSRCNVFQRTGLGFCVINNFQGTFAHFHFLIFTQERINKYVDSMSVKSSTVRCLSNSVVDVYRYCWELWKQLISSNFQNNYHNREKNRSYPSVLFTVASKQKNKNKNTEYHSNFILFKNQVYSKLWSPIFLLLGSLCLVLYLHVWLKSKIFR